ncbi:MAG TPA: 4-(cytidine 5'-diphospho)-2-C-methyl-D-erythritol kinase [Candidatus Krumholzibacteria bacterium]|nr:4-(cytidine 5'-diphospho)-2-C-methyl-D-erythritol kinase [Candidatus Krumholzibacteria bacterium]
MGLTAKAHAKVNLHLEVLAKREDGYHEVETLLQTLQLHDTLQFRPTKGPIHVVCEHPAVPQDRRNLCHIAARMLRKRLQLTAGATIHIHKEIPVAAGLGGGSADAAATLLALCKLWERELEEEELHELARRIGADVPFFLRGGTQLARGVGDELTPLHSSGGGVYFLITPRLELSTAEVYEGLRMGLTHHGPKVNLQNYKSLLSRFPDRTWPGFNRLADVVLPAHPALHRLYLRLQDTEPRLAMMSGSGPSLFAVYSTREEAERAKEELGDLEGFNWIGRSSQVGVQLIKDGN